MLIVMELFNIATSDIGAKKSGRCKYMVVLTELIVSGTHCRLELTLRGRFHFVLWAVVASRSLVQRTTKQRGRGGRPSTCSSTPEIHSANTLLYVLIPTMILTVCTNPNPDSHCM